MSHDNGGKLDSIGELSAGNILSSYKTIKDNAQSTTSVRSNLTDRYKLLNDSVSSKQQQTMTNEMSERIDQLISARRA